MAIPWHRIFGMALTQYFAGTAWRVDVEVDLSLQQQRLDIVVLRHSGHSVEPLWPDGFGTPAEYNLLTFKALKDPLLPWVIKELVGWRQLSQISQRRPGSIAAGRALSIAGGQHALSARAARSVADRVPLQPRGPGAYDLIWGTDTIRILVLREMPEAEQNLVWNLFSGDRDRIATAFQRIQPQRQSWSAVVNELLAHYGLEGMAMPYTMEDFEREAKQELLEKLRPEELLARLTAEQRLEGLSPEQLLARVAAEQRLEGPSAEQLLSLVPLAEIEKFLRKHKTGADKTSPEPPKPQP